MHGLGICEQRILRGVVRTYCEDMLDLARLQVLIASRDTRERLYPDRSDDTCSVYVHQTKHE